MTHTTFTEPAFDGRSVFFNSWQADGGGKATIVLIHGLGEHSGRYAHFATFFADHDINVLAVDTFGHGKTEGIQGHTPKMNDYLELIDQTLKKAAELYSKPVFLYGHSMGGGLVLNYAFKKNANANMKGVIASGPAVKPGFPIPFFKLLLGKVGRLIKPSLTQPNGLNVNHLSKDKAVIEAYKADPLVHDKVSAELGMGLLEWGDWLVENAKEIKLPLLVMHGSEDTITNFEAAKNWTNAVKGDVTFKAWEGMYHEIHNEAQQNEVFEFTLQWILKKIG